MGVIVKQPIMGVVIKPKPVLGVVIKPPHPILGVVIHPPGLVINPPHPIMGVVIHHPDHDDDDDHHFWWHHYHRPWMVEYGTPRVSAAVTTVPTAQTAQTAPCTCLTKNYLTDGSVMFKDVCTKEAAVATPAELKAQMQGSGQ
jgi:hypothetical protein